MFPYSSIVYARTPKVVYLTFDDGPSLTYTPKIRAILRQEHVHATFFVLGFRVKSFPRIVQSLVRDGHEIGNHGYHHEYLLNKNPQWAVGDIRRTDLVIRATTGHIPSLYRPPGGIITSTEAKAIRKLGHPIRLWTVDSRDWASDNSNEIVRNVMTHVQPGAIILMHDGVSNSRYTVQALPTIIHKLKVRGYQFSTLS